MLQVEGMATLKVRFIANVPVTQEDFDKLSERSQNQLLDDHIDWANVTQNAELDDIDIFEMDEI